MNIRCVHLKLGKSYVYAGQWTTYVSAKKEQNASKDSGVCTLSQTNPKVCTMKGSALRDVF